MNKEERAIELKRFQRGRMMKRIAFILVLAILMVSLIELVIMKSEIDIEVFVDFMIGFILVLSSLLSAWLQYEEKELSQSLTEIEEAKMLIGKQYFWTYICMIATPTILYTVVLTEFYYLMFPFIISYFVTAAVEGYFETRVQEIDEEHPIKDEIDKVSLW